MAAGGAEGGAESQFPNSADARSAQDGEFNRAAEAIHQCDAGKSGPRQSLQAGHHRVDAAGPAHPVGGPGRPARMFQQVRANCTPYARKLLVAVGAIVSTLPNAFPSPAIPAAAIPTRTTGNCPSTAPTPPAPCCRPAA